MAQKVKYFNSGPPTIEDRFYDCLCAWYWGQKEYAVLLMDHLIEDEVERELRHKNKGKADGQALATKEEAAPQGYSEDGTDYAWNGWRFSNGHD